MSSSHRGTARIRAKQKQTALQMLVLSGVIRPSHIEPRYCVPLIGLKRESHANGLTRSEVAPSPAVGQTISAREISITLPEWLRPSFSLTPLFRRLDGAGPAEG
jgi:hypothetical protein